MKKGKHGLSFHKGETKKGKHGISFHAYLFSFRKLETKFGKPATKKGKAGFSFGNSRTQFESSCRWCSGHEKQLALNRKTHRMTGDSHKKAEVWL